MKISALRGLVPGLVIACSVLVSSPMVAAQSASSSKTLELIRKRASIQIGVKTDFVPFGQLDKNGQPQGLEVDLAYDLARQLGVRATLVSVTTENRFRLLEQGHVDVLIATASDTQARREIATAIEPHYYSGGVNVLLRPNQRITDWAALRGQTLCATQSSYFNRPASQRYLLKLVIYRDTRDALLALREGRCMGYLYSGPAIQGLLKKPEWAGYTAPLPEVIRAPWAIQIARSEAGSQLEHLIGDVVAQWHRSGFLIAREQAWGIQPTRFLEEERARWSHREPSGTHTCSRDAQGQWPLACRNLSFVRADEAGGFLSLGLWLRDKTEVNLTLLYDAYDRRVFFNGIAHTLALMTGAIVFSLLVGVAGALLVEARWPLVGPLVRAIGFYGRTAPPLLMMYLVFFGLGSLLANRFNWDLSPIWVAIGCMGYYAGASIMNLLLDAANHLRASQADFRLRPHNLTRLTELSAGRLRWILTNVLKQSVMASAIAVPGGHHDHV